MRTKIMLLVAGLALATPLEANAALQCVTYAREASGLNLKGDAWKWWEAAQGVYDRGTTPKDGAVLVFKRQGSMSHGHVSVVQKMVSSRVVLVDHANWAPRGTAGRGKVTHAVPVMDVSPKNDWSQVRVWYNPAQEFGDRIYKTQGYVYRPGSSRSHVTPASLRTEDMASPVKSAPVPAKTKANTENTSVSTPSMDETLTVKAVETPTAAVAPAADAAADVGKIDFRAWAEQA
ncbi:Surface antigen [Candidatus Terasakiella magnetica]|nr:Surface antigen [Candidatus Terasakiella magnetica]